MLYKRSASVTTMITSGPMIYACGCFSSYCKCLIFAILVFSFIKLILLCWWHMSCLPKANSIEKATALDGLTLNNNNKKLIKSKGLVNVKRNENKHTSNLRDQKCSQPTSRQSKNGLSFKSANFKQNNKIAPTASLCIIKHF